MKYLDPKADLTFKRVFGEHPDLVMSLLNALLPLNPGEEITSITYLSSDLVPENPLRKYSIVDVRCTDKLGRQFLTEVGGKTDEVSEELLSDPIVNKALNVVEESAFTSAQLYAYEKFWDAISVEKTLYYGGLRKGMAEGIEKGIEKGKAEGKAEGLAEGLAEGIAKGKAEEQRHIAAQLKKRGAAPEIIVQCTGLSIEEIELL